MIEYLGLLAVQLSLAILGSVPPLLEGATGPFGKNAKKLFALSAVLVMNGDCLNASSISNRYSASGKVQSTLLLIGIVVIVSMGAIFVLNIWSNATKSTGRHKGVSRMVHDSKGSKALQPEFFWKLVCFACGNALCEESEYRGFYASELESIGYNTHFVNFIQSVSFGIAHWDGIPSGAVGVVLAGIYGILMGLLRIYFGIMTSIACHAIADLFIFAVIARKGFSSPA